MRELIQLIPDVDVLLALEPEEVGAKLLFLVRGRVEQGMFHPSSLVDETGNSIHSNEPQYPPNRQREVQIALLEAWAWLEAQGLVIPAIGINGTNGFRILSRRSRKFEDEAEFRGFAMVHNLPKTLLHPALASTVWLHFVRGEFDVAVFQAMKAVEVAVRQACGYSDSAIGVAMMRNAFHKTTGPLTDLQRDEGERDALSNLFAGSIGSYKNPVSHRQVTLVDPVEAIEIILLASHLLRIVESRRPNKGSGSSLQ